MGLAGCLDAPELDDRVPASVQDADYPALVPLDSVLRGVSQEKATKEADDLAARVDRLRQKADRLSGPVLDDASRDRLNDTVGG